MEQVLSIGEVAKQAGVSVQTLRHYDKLGLLVPSAVTAAGYRQYSPHDVSRLALIRTLRDVGFDLRTIARVLASEQDVGGAMRMQIEALEAQRRALKRQQLILKAAINDEQPTELARLHRKKVLAQLDQLEREAFLARHLGWRPDDPPASQTVWRAAIFDLPEEMDEAQLEAWLELAEIAADACVRQTLERQWQLPSGVGEEDKAEWRALFQGLLSDAVRAVREGRSHDDPASQALVDVWIQGVAKLLSRTPDAAFTRWVVEYFESVYDPRIARYWELVSQLKHMPYDPVYAQATDWLIAGLRAKRRSCG